MGCRSFVQQHSYRCCRQSRRRDWDSDKIYSRYRCSKENTSDPGAGAVATAIYILCLWLKKKFESYFRDRLTFSNIDSRTSRRIYRLALLLRAPETLSSLSKSRISIFNAHLTLLVCKMTSHNSSGKYRHLVY